MTPTQNAAALGQGDGATTDRTGHPHSSIEGTPVPTLLSEDAARRALRDALQNGTTRGMDYRPFTGVRRLIVKALQNGTTPETLPELVDGDPEFAAELLAIGALPEEPPAAPFTLVTCEEAMHAPTPEYLIGFGKMRVIMRHGMSFVYGDPGGGKSTWVLDIGLHIAAGLPWMDYQTKQGAVVYVVAEDGVEITGERMRAWYEYHAANVPAPLDNFYLIDDTCHLFNAPHPDGKDPYGLVRTLEEAGVQPILIILDTLARCSEGANENSIDMSVVAGRAEHIAKATGACALLVHHTSKNGDARGHTSLLGAATGAFKISPSGNAGTMVELTCEKQKGSAKFPPISMAMKPSGGACVLIPASKAELDGGLSPMQKEILEAIWSAEIAGVHLTSKQLGDTIVPPKAPGKQANKNKFYQQLGLLKSWAGDNPAGVGYIREEPDGKYTRWHLTEKGKTYMEESHHDA